MSGLTGACRTSVADRRAGVGPRRRARRWIGAPRRRAMAVRSRVGRRARRAVRGHRRVRHRRSRWPVAARQRPSWWSAACRRTAAPARLPAAPGRRAGSVAGGFVPVRLAGGRGATPGVTSGVEGSGPRWRRATSAPTDVATRRGAGDLAAARRVRDRRRRRRAGRRAVRHARRSPDPMVITRGGATLPVAAAAAPAGRADASTIRGIIDTAVPSPPSLSRRAITPTAPGPLGGRGAARPAGRTTSPRRPRTIDGPSPRVDGSARGRRPRPAHERAVRWSAVRRAPVRAIATAARVLADVGRPGDGGGPPASDGRGAPRPSRRRARRRSPATPLPSGRADEPGAGGPGRRPGPGGRWRRAWRSRAGAAAGRSGPAPTGHARAARRSGRALDPTRWSVRTHLVQPRRRRHRRSGHDGRADRGALGHRALGCGALGEVVDVRIERARAAGARRRSRRLARSPRPGGRRRSAACGRRGRSRSRLAGGDRGRPGPVRPAVPPDVGTGAGRGRAVAGR